MKRSQIVLVTVVFTALLTGILMERARGAGTFEDLGLPAPRGEELAHLRAPVGEHRIAGRVEAETPERAAGVLVELVPLEASEEVRPLFWTVTDEEGRFALEELPAGAFRATLVQPGNETQSLDVTVPAEGELHWRLGPPRPPIPELPDLARVLLRGSLADRAGRALAGLQVVAHPLSPVEALTGAETRRAAADAAGRFAFEGLVVDGYAFEVLPGWASGGSWPVLARATRTAEELRAGAPLALVLEPAAIAGSLRDARGRPVEGALVLLWPQDDPSRVWPAVQTDEQGAFRLEGLPEGAYVVRLRAGAAALERVVQVAAGQTLALELPPFDP